MSFDSIVASQLDQGTSHIISDIAQLMGATRKEKVVRMCLATLAVSVSRSTLPHHDPPSYSLSLNPRRSSSLHCLPMALKRRCLLRIQNLLTVPDSLDARTKNAQVMIRWAIVGVIDTNVAQPLDRVAYRHNPLLLSSLCFSSYSRDAYKGSNGVRERAVCASLTYCHCAADTLLMRLPSCFIATKFCHLLRFALRTTTLKTRM